MAELKAKIEAILFLTDKPIKALAIARIVNEDVQVVRQAVLELIRDYEERNGGLEIADENGYSLQVKDEFTSIIDEFVPIEMPTALIRTLSAIAIKQPVPQSEIIKIRGAGAYDHIKELLTRDLIHKKEDGRSPILTTTKKFQEYFRLSKDGKSLRNHMRKEERKLTEAEAAAAAAESGVQLGVFDANPDGSLDVAADVMANVEAAVAIAAEAGSTIEASAADSNDMVFDATPPASEELPSEQFDASPDADNKSPVAGSTIESAAESNTEVEITGSHAIDTVAGAVGE